MIITLIDYQLLGVVLVSLGAGSGLTYLVMGAGKRPAPLVLPHGASATIQLPDGPLAHVRVIGRDKSLIGNYTIVEDHTGIWSWPTKLVRLDTEEPA